MAHDLELEVDGNGNHWGECSCRQWSTGPRPTKRQVKDDHRLGHLRTHVTNETTPDGWPSWDDPDDIEEDEDRWL
jgi:hypothetical protein